MTKPIDFDISEERLLYAVTEKEEPAFIEEEGISCLVMRIGFYGDYGDWQALYIPKMGSS